MKKKQYKVKIRAALSAVLIIALLAATAVFVSTSAADVVSDSDVSDSGAPSMGSLQLVFTTGKSSSDTFEFLLNVHDAYVDWGDGQPVYYKSTEEIDSEGGDMNPRYIGQLKGSTVKIYCATEPVGNFWCREQELTNVNVSYASNLVGFNCSNNSLTELDVTQSPQLTWIDCAGNDLTELDVSNNVNLLQLMCSENQLSELDISQNIALKQLYATSNNISSLDISKNTGLTTVHSGNNLLRFDTVNIENTPLDFNTTDFGYQDTIQIPIRVDADTAVDLSEYKEYNGIKTVYKWYDYNTGEEVTPSTEKDGVFTFDNRFANGAYYCIMTNEIAPTLALMTSEVRINYVVTSDGAHIAMTTDKAVGETFEFTLGASSAYVDWGDGNFVLCDGAGETGDSYSGELLGNTVKIYTEQYVYSLSCYNQQLTNIDVSDCPTLESLDCSSNKLSTIDLSYNKNLCSFYCNNNNLTSLDVSNNTALQYVGCDSNGLTSLNVTKNTALFDLSCFNNNLTSLDVSNCTSLKSLTCANNSLSKLDISKNNLSTLNCEGNKLTEIDVSRQPDLYALWVGRNNLKKLDVSKNSNLMYFGCDSNNLTELDISKNSKLDYLQCYDNDIEILDTSGKDALRMVYCWNNKLKFSTVKRGNADFIFIPAEEDGRVWYSDMGWDIKAQKPISIAASIEVGETIDLSSEYNIDGTKTVYTWYDSDDNEVTPTKSENGIFTFGDELGGKTLYCTMTNGLYADFILKTTSVKINTSEFTVEHKDNTDFVEDAKPSDDMIVRDDEGDIVDLKGVKLVVKNIETNKKKTVLEAIKRYNKEFDADSTDCALYDISLADKSGAKVTVENGRIQVKLKYPDNLGRESEDYTYHLYHQKADGSIEEIEIDCQPNGIWFYADDFSPYILTWEKKSAGSDNGTTPATGESITLTIVASCLAVLSLAAAAAVIYKKKFAASSK